MRKIIFILLSLLVFSGCRSHKSAVQEYHFSDTAQIIVADTIHYEENSIKVILEPKNEPVFKNQEDLISGINSSNYSVKSVEVKRSDIRLDENAGIQSKQKTEITSLSEENEAKIAGKESKERKSLKIVIYVILTAIVSAIAICVYDRINGMRFSSIRQLSREFEKYSTDRWTY